MLQKNKENDEKEQTAQLINKHQFYEIVKHASNPTGGPMLQADPKYQFFKNMEGFGEMPKSFLDNISNKTLFLKQTSLTKGTTVSLKNAIKIFDVNRIILDNNQINDAEFCGVLQAVPPTIKSIVYRYNELGPSSFGVLDSILARD